MISDFYKSREWVNLMQVLRIERQNAAGEIICAHCGKPIVHKYDCIGHHIEPLTEQNYRLAEIALNPDNIALVHHRCHNKIHDRLGLSYTKQVYLVYGSPMSGKTTWVKDNMNAGDLVVDMDNIWECISAQPRYTKPKRLTQTAFAIRDSLIDQIRTRRGNWLNAYLIGGFPLISERERYCRSLGAREILIDTPKEECLQRLKGTERDTAEYRRYIEDWWEKFLKYPPSL
jgi:predicted kinase